MLFAVCYGIGAGAFLVLIALMLLNTRPRGFGLAVFSTCAMTAIWAISAAIQPWWMPGVAHSLESLAATAWLFLVGWVALPDHARGKTGVPVAWFPLLLLAVGLIAFIDDLRFIASTPSPWNFAPSQILARVAVAVCGLLAIENLYRNTSPGRRWHILPFCIALGALFSYNLFAFCEAVVLKSPDPALLAARGLVLALMVPPLALTMVRNLHWNINVHVSRDAVFHGTTLTGAGIFVLLAAGVASLIGKIPGRWAAISEIVFFSGTIVLLLIVLSAGSFRSRIKRVINENFFSARYDYRVEWMRSVATLTAGESGEPLSVRAIRALADVVDSPGGALWMQDSRGNYKIEQTLNMRIDPAATQPATTAFISQLGGGEAIREFSDMKGDSLGPAPSWAQSLPAWLAIPLMKTDQMVGFIVLASPRVPTVLNWESRNLLLTVGQQVAGFIAEERATRTLLESQTLIDYSKRFSFVMHDIKNVAGQLGLMVANVQKFGDQPEFRADLIRSLENSVNKLSLLVARLRPDAAQDEIPVSLDPAAIIGSVAKELSTADIPVRARTTLANVRVYIVPSTLHAIITHLVKNAVEASVEGDRVWVELTRDKGRVFIDILDNGCGMSPDFIETSLFVPLRSTKARGHGIGAFQARDLARAAGGDIEVTSTVRKGTRMRVILPECIAAGEAPMAEAVSA